MNSKGFYQSFEKEQKNGCLVKCPPENVKLVSFLSRWSYEGKKYTKKCDAPAAKLLFCLSKPIAFFPFSYCCPHRHCLKLPINPNIPQNSQVVSNCKPIAFLPFSLLSSPSLLKLPINSNIPQNSYSEQLGIKQQFSFYRRMAMPVPVSWRLQGTCNSKRIPGLNNVRKRYSLTIKDNLAIPCYSV